MGQIRLIARPGSLSTRQIAGVGLSVKYPLTCVQVCKKRGVTLLTLNDKFIKQTNKSFKNTFQQMKNLWNSTEIYTFLVFFLPFIMEHNFFFFFWGGRGGAQLRQFNLETLFFFGVWSITSGYSLEINYYMQFTRPRKNWHIFSISHKRPQKQKRDLRVICSNTVL